MRKMANDKTRCQRLFSKVFEDIISSFEEGFPDKSIAIFTIWNSLFPDCPVNCNSKIEDQVLVVLNKYIMFRRTDRFCFEFSVLFLDDPKLFQKIVNLFPPPLSIAMRIAYNILTDHFEKVTPEKIYNFMDLSIKTIKDPQRFSQIMKGFLAQQNSTRIVVKQMHALLNSECFNSFLSILPPQKHFHYSIKYNTIPPKLVIDFNHFSLPFEFLQTIADINGEEYALNLISPESE